MHDIVSKSERLKKLFQILIIWLLKFLHDFMIFNYLYKFLLKKFIKQLNVMKSKLLQFRYLKVEGWVRFTKKITTWLHKNLSSPILQENRHNQVYVQHSTLRTISAKQKKNSSSLFTCLQYKQSPTLNSLKMKNDSTVTLQATGHVHTVRITLKFQKWNHQKVEETMICVAC